MVSEMSSAVYLPSVLGTRVCNRKPRKLEKKKRNVLIPPANNLLCALVENHLARNKTSVKRRRLFENKKDVN